MNITFQEPRWLVLLLLIPLMIWWYRRSGHKIEGAIRFSSLSLFDEAAIKSGRLKAQSIRIAKNLLIMLMVVGLARPQITDVVRESSAEVIDIVMVLDISTSMLAADFKPNRLEAAKKVAEQFITDRPFDRIGIIIFAGESYIQCPLTHDTNVLLNLLEQVAIIDKEHDGTAIGMAVANAINRLRDSEAESKVMILLSDGSNNAGELAPSTAAELAKQFGIKIYTIGAGSRGVAPYPVNDPVWGTRMVNVEVSLDEESLKQLAGITGGRYYRATDQESLAEIYAEINELERTEIQVSEYLNVEDLYGWLVIPACLVGFMIPVTSMGLFRSSQT